MALEDDIRALERTPLIGAIGREALRLLAFSSEAKRLAAGEALFFRGAPADTAFAVIRGRISLLRTDGSVDRVVGPGGLIGELALLVETQRPANAVAAEASLLLVISRTLFRRMLEEYPDITRSVRDYLVRRLRADQDELERIRMGLIGLDTPADEPSNKG